MLDRGKVGGMQMSFVCGCLRLQLCLLCLQRLCFGFGFGNSRSFLFPVGTMFMKRLFVFLTISYHHEFFAAIEKCFGFCKLNTLAKLTNFSIIVMKLVPILCGLLVLYIYGHIVTNSSKVPVLTLWLLSLFFCLLLFTLARTNRDT